MTQIPPAYLEAFERWGYLADQEAKKYGVANGATLLAKLTYIESRFNQKAVSSAGARGATQFISSTRDAYKQRYGIDPWKSFDEAIHAAAIFLKTTGLSGYNPGSSTYISEVLGAPVGKLDRGAGPGATRKRSPAPAIAAGAESSSSSSGDTLVRFLLSATLVLGGFGLMGLGLSRAVGSSPFDAASLRLRAQA